MWICKFCIVRMKKKVPEVLTFNACGQCFNPMAECAEESALFNIGSSNWHKHTEENNHSSSPADLPIPENGLYLWLRPITQTSSKTDLKGASNE